MKAIGLESCTGLFFMYPVTSAAATSSGRFSHVVGFHTAGGTIEEFMNPTSAHWPFNVYGVGSSAIVAVVALNESAVTDDDSTPWEDTVYGVSYRAEIQKLTAWGLAEDNIYIYNGCQGAFGVSLFGDVGE